MAGGRHGETDLADRWWRATTSRFRGVWAEGSGSLGKKLVLTGRALGASARDAMRPAVVMLLWGSIGLGVAYLVVWLVGD